MNARNLQTFRETAFDTMSSGEGISLDEALNLVGTGSFQWLILGICGLANAADAVEILSIGLVLPSAEDQLNLRPEDEGLLTSCIFMGMLIGGLAWGMAGDLVGRKWSLVLAMLLNSAFGALSASAHSVTSLVVFRTIAGVGVGGSVPVVFTHLAELLPIATRGKFMILLAAHWMVGSLYSAGVGWAVIPAYGWRPFLLLAAAPAGLCCALAAALLPESPRYLLVKGRHGEALQVLHNAAHTNGRKLDPEVKLAPIHDHGFADAPGRAPHASVGQQLKLQAVRAGLALRALLTAPLLKYTIPLLLGWVGMCGGWYSTVLWIPEFFKRRCEAAGNCKEVSIYAVAFWVALANLPGNVASVYMVDYLGRRLTCTLCLAGACICALLFAAAPATGIVPLMAACVFNGVSVGGWNSLDLLSAELYPTSVRSSGMGLLGATGRLSSAVSTYLAGILVNKQLWLPLVMAAVLLAIGSAAMMTLPEPTGQPLADVVADGQHVAEPSTHSPRTQYHRLDSTGETDSNVASV